MNNRVNTVDLGFVYAYLNMHMTLEMANNRVTNDHMLSRSSANRTSVL